MKTIFLGAALLLCLSTAFAAEDPSAYVVTLARFDLKMASGEWVEVVDPDRPVDLVREEAAVAFFNSGQIPEGRYVNFRLWILNGIRIALPPGVRQDGPIRVRLDCLETGANVLAIEKMDSFVRPLPKEELEIFFAGPTGPNPEFIRIERAQDLVPELSVVKGTFLRVSLRPDLRGLVRRSDKGVTYVLPPLRLEDIEVTAGEATPVVRPEELRFSFVNDNQTTTFQPDNRKEPPMALTPSTMISLGTKAPDFDLPDVVTGRRVTLQQFEGKKALLVMFICQHCPYVQHVERQLAAIGRDFGGAGLGIVAISANDIQAYPDDRPERLREMSEKLQFVFPLCYDESQEAAKRYSASCTPDFFLFDENRRLVYRGQLDDSRPGNDKPVTGRDLREAISAALEGRPISEQQKPSMGCGIKWRPGNEPAYAR